MQFTSDINGKTTALITLFTETFSASEGEAEGAVIGELVRALLATTPTDDLIAFLAEEKGALVGAIFFTRLRFDADPRTVFLLSPVAVKTARQGQGIGQNLLRHGLAALKAQGVDVAITYGDPNYYVRVGFQPMTEGHAQPPQTLSYPHGWLAQTLDGRAFDPLKGRSVCAPALDDPAYW